MVAASPWQSEKKQNKGKLKKQPGKDFTPPDDLAELAPMAVSQMKKSPSREGFTPPDDLLSSADDSADGDADAR